MSTVLMFITSRENNNVEQQWGRLAYDGFVAALLPCFSDPEKIVALRERKRLTDVTFKKKKKKLPFLRFCFLF